LLGKLLELGLGDELRLSTGEELGVLLGLHTMLMGKEGTDAPMPNCLRCRAAPLSDNLALVMGKWGTGAFHGAWGHPVSDSLCASMTTPGPEAQLISAAVPLFLS
jgi:hypothetical protein